MRPAHLSLFSGIGGADLASEEVGWRTIAFSEIEPFPCAVLKEHWPNVPNLGDIRGITAGRVSELTVQQVDLVTGGPPCQPSSDAGKRRGPNDDRWLWMEYLRVVRDVQPRWCIAENPTGIFTLDKGIHFRNILRTLTTMGYVVSWMRFPANAVGAPHERQRFFIVAYNYTLGRHGGSGSEWETGGIESEDSRQAGDSWRGAAFSRVVDHVRGFSGGLVGHRFPAGKGQAQFDYEPGRLAQREKNRSHKIAALGNAILPQHIYPLLKAIWDTDPHYAEW